MDLNGKVFLLNLGVDRIRLGQFHGQCNEIIYYLHSRNLDTDELHHAQKLSDHDHLKKFTRRTFAPNFVKDEKMV